MDEGEARNVEEGETRNVEEGETRNVEEGEARKGHTITFDRASCQCCPSLYDSHYV